ncbi:MAG: hypothetical protein J7M14_06360 [Planctomycetes bacterium]|nr:hypothetical protein [Planctomycetota bacterium]
MQRMQKMQIMKLSAVALQVSILLAAGAASADMLDYDGLGLHSKVKMHGRGTLVHHKTINAGEMKFSYKGVDFISYCVDLYHYAGDANVSELSMDELNNGDLVAELFSTYADQVDRGDYAAALQTAIWEVIYEEPENDFDLTDGYLKIDHRSGTAGAAIADLANSLLAGLNGNSNAGDDMVFLHTPTRQDTIIPGGMVPEPTTLTVIVSGAMVLAYGRRSRRMAV